MTFDLLHVTSRDPLLTADGTVRSALYTIYGPINDVHSLCNNYDFVLLVFTCHVSRSINLFPPLHMSPLPSPLPGLTALSNCVILIPFHLTINSVLSIYHRCKNAYSALKLHLESLRSGVMVGNALIDLLIPHVFCEIIDSILSMVRSWP